MAVQNKQWHFNVGLPDGVDADTRVRIAADAIATVVSRTKSKKNIWGRKFVRYTKAYAKRKGVGRTSVNLTLSNDMLTSIRLLNRRKNNLKIGFVAGSKENAKAEGNMLGTYGKPTPVQSPRKFLGMTSKEIVALVKRHAPEFTRSEILDAQTNPTIATTK